MLQRPVTCELLATAPWILLRGNHEDCSRAGEGWFRFLDRAPMESACRDLSGIFVARQGNFGVVVGDGAKADDPRAAFVFDEAIRTGAIGTELPIPLDKLEHMQKQLVATGSMPRPSDLEKFVERGAREQALALV